MALKKCKECKKDVSTKAKTCPNCGASVPQNVGIGTIVFVIFVIYIFYAVISAENKPKPAKIKSPTEIALEQVKLLDYQWYKEGFGTVMEADFLISNDGDRDVKDIEITCDHSGNSGTKIDSNTRTIYEIVKAKKKRKIKKFNMGFINNQASSSACRITSIKLAP